MHSVRSQARRHAYPHTSSPLLSKSTTRNSEAGGLNEKQDGRAPASAVRAGDGVAVDDNVEGGGAGARDLSGHPEAANTNEKADAPSQSAPPPAPPPHKSETAGSGISPVETEQVGKEKKPISTRMKDGSWRFVGHFKDALFSNWVNVLLVFVPVGIAVEAIGASPAIVFAMNAIAIVPLAGLLSHATESVAARLGDTLGALLNVSFGNAVELIIFIIALVKREIGIVQASLLGSILANLLLILGMAFLFGGLRYREQIYNSTVTQMSACMLSLSVMSLLLPTAFHASFNTASADDADTSVLKVSRGTSVILLLVYVLYLAFQLKSHAYLYESTPQAVIDEESHPGVLHDMLNSSSSSDSSSSSSSDSDTSASITTAGKRIKRAFTQRRRRKSSGSASSVTNSVPNSALSSPSATDNRSSFLGGENGSTHASHRQSAFGAISSEADADADREDNHGVGPRVRDFGKANGSGSKSPELKKRDKKSHKKKHRKHRKAEEAAQQKNADVAIVDDHLTEEPEHQVQFADDVQTAENTAANSHPKPAFNKRMASTLHRPALPKMLSNNVFVTQSQPQQAHSQPRPSGPSRAASSGAGLRRTSSLPDRLNEQQSSNQSHRPIVVRTDALPPYPRQPNRVDSDHLGKNVEDDEDGPVHMSRTAAVVLLLCSTALVAVCAEFMVDAIPGMITPGSAVSQTFIGLIILPIVGNAAEHVTAVTVATKNKMDLAIGVAIGSSIQIALFITPVVVLLGWILDRDMSLYFNLFETISLFVTAFVVNFLILDGRSNYLEGSLLIAAYVIIALGAFFYPQTGNQSAVGSVGTDGLGK